MATHGLALNAGSSSRKVGLYQQADGELRRLRRGVVDGMGTPHAELRIPHDDDAIQETIAPAVDHAAAIGRALDQIEIARRGRFDAIGHRIVHGGTRFGGPALIDTSVLDELRALIHGHRPARLDRRDR